MAVVDWGLIMAAGVTVTIPALVVFIAVRRYLIAGWGADGLSAEDARERHSADRPDAMNTLCRFVSGFFSTVVA